MTRIAAAALAALIATAPLARANEEPPGEMSEGIDLLEEGARMFMRGLMNEMEPALRELAEGMEPAMRELLSIVDDFDAYHLPERLPNGDIIIRRKRPDDAPGTGPDDPAPAPEGEIEI